MKHVPWHVKGVRPEVREVARDAARRSGLSVGAWLNSLIVDAAARGYRRPATPDQAARLRSARIDEAAFTAIRKDIDELKRQMSRPQTEPAVFEQRLHDIEARITALQSSTRPGDVEETLHRHFAVFRESLREAPPVEELAKVWRQDLVEISAALRDAMPTSVLVALQGQVRALGERLEAHRGADAATEVTADVEHALAGIRDRLEALTPAEDLAELSHAVKLLAHKADSIATASTAPEKMQQLEHAIGALQGIASQVASRDVIAALSHDIRALGDKIDRGNRVSVDSDFMNTLERRLAEIAEAVGRCRPLEDAPVPPNFDAVINALADRLEAIQTPAADQDALKSLEQRIDTLVDKLDNSETRPDGRDGTDRGMDELLAQIKELRAQNDSRLAAIQQQLVTSAVDAISGPAESIRRDVASLKEIQTSVDRRTQDTFEAVYGTIEQVVDRLATIEDGLREGHYGPAGDQLVDRPEWGGATAATHIHYAPAMAAEASTLVPSAKPMADRAAAAPTGELEREHDWAAATQTGMLSNQSSVASALLRHPAAPDFAPDTPIEPGSGARRVRVVADAIDRIAASEAANGTAKPAETTAPARANFVAAARRAAQAVASEHDGAPAARVEKPAADIRKNFHTGNLLGLLRPRIKSFVLGVAAIILVLGALRLALDFLHDPGGLESAQPFTEMNNAVQRGDEALPQQAPEPPLDQPAAQKGAALESPPPAAPDINRFPDETMFGQAQRTGFLADVAATAAIPHAMFPRASATLPTVTAAAPDLAEIPLPPTIGSKALIAAASAGDPGASYEVATRFAQGRNVPLDLATAAAWFERAARKGLAPAQFRLGSMYEKGLGIKKDLAEARRLYVAAADKGHAKAMHNLAVLYAEGLDGKPDYAVASQWFRRAAMHGIVDSQYNLAILYARGVGVERNLAESYKWFALAAKGGDKDAARKRDEVAGRLDAKQLESARLNAESFMAEPQPDEANATRAPAGGWDPVVTAATTKSKVAR